SARDYLSSRAPKPERHSDYAMEPAAVSATALGTLLIGAGAMWLFDPDRGRARRAWIGQKITRAVNEMGDFARATGRHLPNKSNAHAPRIRTAADTGGKKVGFRSRGSSEQATKTPPPLM